MPQPKVFLQYAMYQTITLCDLSANFNQKRDLSLILYWFRVAYLIGMDPSLITSTLDSKSGCEIIIVHSASMKRCLPMAVSCPTTFFNPRRAQ